MGRPTQPGALQNKLYNHRREDISAPKAENIFGPSGRCSGNSGVKGRLYEVVIIKVEVFQGGERIIHRASERVAAGNRASKANTAYAIGVPESGEHMIFHAAIPVSSSIVVDDNRQEWEIKAANVSATVTRALHVATSGTPLSIGIEDFQQDLVREFIDSPAATSNIIMTALPSAK
ncbi:hypothetical protein BJV74DRAFT_988886 [Russula compacta]|nr:hypothetical protein BJV74DRAFT_988886 [Russula compacta]